jgi:hypothetical protein
MKNMIRNVTAEIADFFRMLLLKDYSTTDACSKAIISSIQKEKNEVDKFSIQAECKMRYFQILVFWFILPFATLFLPILVGFNYIIFIKQSNQMLTDIIIIVTEIIIFIALYNSIFKRAFTGIKILFQTEQQLIDAEYRNKLETKKGQIPLILLHELIKNESGQSNWFYILSDVSKELKEPIEALYNIRLKNLTGEKNERFRSFNSIKIASEGQRTTHLSYVKQLMSIYRLTNDELLLSNAQKLHDYIERTPLSK